MFIPWPLAAYALLYAHLPFVVKGQTTNAVCVSNPETEFTFNSAGESPWYVTGLLSWRDMR